MTITKKWFQLDLGSKLYMKNFLWNVYKNYPIDVGAMQRDKTAQLIALISKRSFPSEWTDFIDEVVEGLFKTKFLLGVTLLKASFNEIVSSRPDVPYQIKKNFIQGYVVIILKVVYHDV